MVRPPSVRRWTELSLNALATNAERARGLGDLADLRADAYGHGLESSAQALDGLGFSGFVVSPEGRERLDKAVRTPLVDAHDVAAERIVSAPLYGLAEGWRPALRAGAEILAVKDVPAGDGVSYGYTYTAPRDTRLALIGAGYAHGIVRRASNTARVLVGGLQRTIVGVISMDQLTVDLDGATVSEGDECVLFGDPERGEPSLAQWQQATGIRALAITARIAPRFERRIA